MYSVSEVVEKPFSKVKVVSSKKIVAMIKEAKKEPEVILAAKEFYRYHTGKELKIL